MLFFAFEAAALAAALSLDAFVASLSYGCSGIKIPAKSIGVIGGICSAFLGVSLFAGRIVRDFIPSSITSAVCFVILLVLGGVKLLDGFTKALIRKHSGIRREINFTFSNFRFILTLYADPEKADADESKLISPSEAASLAAALSLDGLAAGFGAAVGGVNIPAVLLYSLCATILAAGLGWRLGNKLTCGKKLDLSWLCGALLIVLGILKLIK